MESPKFWIFSNKTPGHYGDSIWDMTTIMHRNKYSIKEKEPNRKSVHLGDQGLLRLYGQGFIGTFKIASEWTPIPANLQKLEEVIVGTFDMQDVVTWPSPLPQSLVLSQLSNQNFRHRIAKISPQDFDMINTARHIYDRLGFGEGVGEIFLLEKGIEEAIKPNLKQLGLRLAGKDIEEQFSMGPGVGRSDLICLDKNNDLVVIELKRGRASGEVIGQVLRYVQWIRENIAKPNQSVRGCIIASQFDEHLRLASRAADVRLLIVRFG